jgi:hypothetical protein
MKLIEIFVWDALYWALYLPCSIVLYAITGQGDILGILIIGAVLTTVLSVFLATQDGLIFDDWEPAIVLSPIKKQVEVTTYDKKQEEKPQPEPASSARLPVGFEPGAKMRTDVDLGSLDADDDDTLS